MGKIINYSQHVEIGGKLIIEVLNEEDLIKIKLKKKSSEFDEEDEDDNDTNGDDEEDELKSEI